jgi:hypothetical protein
MKASQNIRQHDVYVSIDSDGDSEVAYVMIVRQKRIVRVIDFAFKTLFVLVCAALACDVAWAWYSGVFDRLVR